MVSKWPLIPPGKNLPVFSVACWLLGLMAFVQLLVAGMAMATRLEESRVVRVIEKEVPKPVVIRVPAAAPAAESGVVSRPPVPVTPPPPVAPMVEPTPLVVPQVADPRSERMLNEARESIVAGDMDKAILKLEEALTQSPEDPSVHYELGRVHEQMGVFDIAADHYQKVREIGLPAAGALYEMASVKLRDGFEKPDAMLGKMSLGRVRIFKNPNHVEGERVILTIPVQKAPAEEIDLEKLEVEVRFFNRNVNGEIIELEDKSWAVDQWVTAPFDWPGGEESLRMTYTIPPQDQQTEHLFGGRTYYGQVVSLIYNGEILDVKPWPPNLAARISRAPAAGPGDMQLPEFQDTLPPDFDPELPLLPALPE
jgi:hypothetical protein